jgi:hypothetical protein
MIARVLMKEADPYVRDRSLGQIIIITFSRADMYAYG